MTKVKEIIQEGPSFETIVNCYGCKYLISTDSLKNSSFIRSNTCSKLDKDLKYSSSNIIAPHLDCPFKTLSQIKYHKSKEQEINNLEFDRVKSIITSIFKYSHDFGKGISMHFYCSETITLNQLKQLEEKLPNYDISFDSYDSEDISVTLNMKAV